MNRKAPYQLVRGSDGKPLLLLNETGLDRICTFNSQDINLEAHARILTASLDMRNLLESLSVLDVQASSADEAAQMAVRLGNEARELLKGLSTRDPALSSRNPESVAPPAAAPCAGLVERLKAFHKLIGAPTPVIADAIAALSRQPAGVAPGEKRPRVVCLCGSTRFMDAFQQANLTETIAGHIVLSIGCNTKSDSDLIALGELTEEAKAALDELHKRKIDLADEVLVLNVGGYIGKSTRSEIDYAEVHGKPVRYLESAARLPRNVSGKEKEKNL